MNEKALKRQMSSRWALLVLGVILLLFLGLIYGWSIFLSPLPAEFGWTASQASLTCSISMMTCCLGGLVGGIINKGKNGFRINLIAAAVLLAIGFFSASNIQSLMGIYLSYGVCCGFGVGLGYNTAISTIVKWFPDKQGLISGITLMGFGFGSMILGTVAGAMIQSMGWRVTFRIFAVAFAIVMVVGALLLRNAGAEFVAYLSQGSSKAVTPAVEEVGAAVMLRRRNFWIYFVWAIILSAAGLAIINSSAPYAQLFVGENLTLAASIAGIVSIANGVGRVIFGGMFDKIGYRLTMLIDCVVFVIAALVLMASYGTMNMVVLVIAFILIGLAYGGVTPTNSAFIAYFFGRENYAVNFPIVNLNLIFASFLGPMVGNGGYMMTFGAIIVFAIVGAVLVFLLKKPEQN